VNIYSAFASATAGPPCGSHDGGLNG